MNLRPSAPKTEALPLSYTPSKLNHCYFRRKFYFMQEFFSQIKSLQPKNLLLDTLNSYGYNFLYRFCQITTVEEYFVIFYKLENFCPLDSTETAAFLV